MLVSEKINHGLEQPLITQFYPVLDKVNKLIKDNENLRQMLLNNINNNESVDYNSSNSFYSKSLKIIDGSINGNLPILLQLLLKSSLNNSKHKPNANKFNETVKKFSLYLFFIGGRLLYETLCKNMPNSLPSIPCLFRYFGKTQQLCEGRFRFMELRKYLHDRNFPLCIWLSEDATRITGRIEYDSASDKLVGFVLPLKNGCPQLDTFIVTSVKSILDAFKTATKSKYAYCIMAQPSVPESPAFCVTVFGTDNRFSYKDVLHRWEFGTK